MGGAPAYAFFVGDADMLENGNVLITNGGIVDPPTVAVQLVEVEPTGTSGGNVVFELAGGRGRVVHLPGPPSAVAVRRWTGRWVACLLWAT